jgi:hypothetical protein
MKVNHSDRQRSTRRLFDERERMVRRRLIAHALFILTFLFILQAGTEKIIGRFLAEPIYAWILLCIVTYVIISIEMLIRQVMFSRMQSPIVFTVLFLFIAVFSFWGAGLAFMRGQDFVQNGILSTGGFRLIVGVMFCLLTSITLIGKRQECITDLEVNSTADEKPRKYKDNYHPYKQMRKQTFDERELQIRSNTFVIGLVLLIVATGINALLAQVGIRWAPPFSALCIQLVLVYITIFIMQLCRGTLQRYPANSFVAGINFIFLSFMWSNDGASEVIKGQKAFMHNHQLSEEGANLVLMILFILGGIAILIAHFYTKARLKREESE